MTSVLTARGCPVLPQPQQGARRLQITVHSTAGSGHFCEDPQEPPAGARVRCATRGRVRGQSGYMNLKGQVMLEFEPNR